MYTKNNVICPVGHFDRSIFFWYTYFSCRYFCHSERSEESVPLSQGRSFTVFRMTIIMRKKLTRFKETENMPCIIQGLDLDIQARLQPILQAGKEIILELGCGNGAYAVALAERNPDKICIGVDIQGERLWYGAKSVQEKKLDNAYFLRVMIDNLEKFFPARFISEIWLTFPDPYPRDKQERKRLVYIRFLTMYKKLLKEGGVVHLKTDNDGLFDYALESINNWGGTVLQCIQIVPDTLPTTDILSVRTYFEDKHRKLGKTIHYLRFC